MWHQRLPRAVYSLVAVMVMTGSLALLGCPNDSNDLQGVQLDPATARTNVTSRNISALANRDIVIDAEAFAFDREATPILGAPAQPTARLRITNVTVFTAVPAAGAATNTACGIVNAAIGGQTPTVPVASANYTVTRLSDGTTFSGTLCIGAGTGGTVTTPGQGGTICTFTNSATSPQPGAQSVYTSCRIAVDVRGTEAVPVDDPRGATGNVGFVVTQQVVNIAFSSTESTPNARVTITRDAVNRNDGHVLVDGTDTGIIVPLLQSQR